MKSIEESKDVYENIEIPKDLNRIVKKTIDEHAKGGKDLDHPKNNKVRFFKYAAAAAAITILCFAAVLNTNEVFAEELEGIPIIGGIAKVLTIRSYEKENENIKISVNVPAVAMEGTQENTEAGQDSADEANEFVIDVNSEIEKIINEYTSDAEKRLNDYKEAFIATGGTEKEWEEREINICVDYEVKYQKDNLLSVILTADESWCSAYGVRYYFNLDLAKNTKLSLEDILGENWVKTANESIVRHMKERAEKDSSYIYWGITDGSDPSDIDGFTSVDENTGFYINDAGNPVICFDKYTVGPGSMGIQEFEIIP